LVNGVEKVFRAQFADEVLFVAFNQQCAQYIALYVAVLWWWL
jgi:hypothetical protein